MAYVCMQAYVHVAVVKRVVIYYVCVTCAQVADIGLGRPRQLAELDDAGVARVLPWAAPELVRAPHTATDKVDVYR